MRLPQTESRYRNNFLIGFTKQKYHNNNNSKKNTSRLKQNKTFNKGILEKRKKKKKNRNVFVLMLLYL